MDFFSSRRFVLAGFIFVFAGMSAAHIIYLKQEFDQSVTETLRPIAIMVLIILALNFAIWVYNRLRSKNAR